MLFSKFDLGLPLEGASCEKEVSYRLLGESAVWIESTLRWCVPSFFSEAETQGMENNLNMDFIKRNLY